MNVCSEHGTNSNVCDSEGCFGLGPTCAGIEGPEPLDRQSRAVAMQGRTEGDTHDEWVLQEAIEQLRAYLDSCRTATHPWDVAMISKCGGVAESIAVLADTNSEDEWTASVARTKDGPTLQDTVEPSLIESLQEGNHC